MGDNYQVIARRWRPRCFSELVGQDPIIQTLSNSIRLNRIAHAFLFIGPRGTGKTSTARLLAMALNAPEKPDISANPDIEPCKSIFEGHCLDVIEIDGASNNSVEQIRSLREECQYTPTFCRFKIYIIDEVHMLSQAAFNALLKTLEEPPEHVKFIFATTEAYKIPATITSRCQRFEFKPIAEDIIVQKLNEIAQQEGINAEPIALHRIAQIAEGGMRDAQSIVDQLISFGDKTITENSVIQAYGLASSEKLEEIFRCVEYADFAGIIRLTHELENCNFHNLLADIVRQIRKKLSQEQSPQNIARYLKFLDIVTQQQDKDNPEIAFQLALFKTIEAWSLYSIDQIITQLKAIKDPNESNNSNSATHENLNKNDNHSEFTTHNRQPNSSHNNSIEPAMHSNENAYKNHPESTTNERLDKNTNDNNFASATNEDRNRTANENHSEALAHKSPNDFKNQQKPTISKKPSKNAQELHSESATHENLDKNDLKDHPETLESKPDLNRGKLSSLPDTMQSKLSQLFHIDQ